MVLKQYEPAEMEIIEFEAEDIITASTKTKILADPTDESIYLEE